METISKEEEQRCIIKGLETHKRGLVKRIQSTEDPGLKKAFLGELQKADVWMNKCKADLYDNT